MQSFDQKPAATSELPTEARSSVETLSGISDSPRVAPAAGDSGNPMLSSLAYAQGSRVQVAPGQEKHLPHEAWHVVQQ